MVVKRTFRPVANFGQQALYHGSRAAVSCIFCKKLYPYKSWFLLSAHFFNELHFSDCPERFIPYFMENFKTQKTKTAYFLFKHWFRFLFLKEIDRERNLAWWPHPSLSATLSHFASRKHLDKWVTRFACLPWPLHAAKTTSASV